MDEFIKLAKNSIEYFLENKNYLDVKTKNYDKNHNGVFVEIYKNGLLRSISGESLPVRKNILYDIIYESVKAAFFTKKSDPITKENLKEIKIVIKEIYDLEIINFLDETDDFDGLELTYQNNTFTLFLENYKNKEELLKDLLKKSNVDSWDIFILKKFKVIKHI